MSKETTQQAVFTTINGLLEPWTKAANAFSAESEKFQQAAFDGAVRALDDTNKLAKESLKVASTVSAAMLKQMTNQVERAAELFNTIQG